MSLRFDETFPVASDPLTVWSCLQDVAFVAQCFPGATLEEELEDGSYRGRLAMKLGPTRAEFAGTVAFAMDHDERAAQLTARGGDGRRTQAAANGTIRVAQPGAGEDTSLLHLDVTIDVSGPLGQFAKTGGRELTRQLLHDFVRSVEQALVPAPVAGDAERATATTSAGSERDAAGSSASEIRAGRLVLRSIRATLVRWARSSWQWLRTRLRRKAKS